MRAHKVKESERVSKIKTQNTHACQPVQQTGRRAATTQTTRNNNTTVRASGLYFVLSRSIAFN